MEYTAQNLEYAVSVFYNGDLTADRAKAHSWLTLAQRAPEAWNFVWELLQPNKGTEIQFYAATTLHTKILRCWNEVPPESYDELKNKILHAIFTYSKGPKIVTNRLCISLAAFILQQGTNDLASILTPLSSAENMALLLEVLTVIPEEYSSMTMGAALRTKNRTALQQACPAVLDDMLRYLQSVFNDYSQEPPSEAVVQSWLAAASCASSWLGLGGEESDHCTLPDRLPLCHALLTVVHVLYTVNECVSDSALDACEVCLTAVRAAGAAFDTSRYPQAAMQLLVELAALTAPVAQRHNVPNSINEELLSSLITCCVALSEFHARCLVKAVEGVDGLEAYKEGAYQMIELLLSVQAAPGHYPLHETRSNLVFGFWYTLQDEVLNLMDNNEQALIHPVWREVYMRLLDTLIRKSEAPEDHLLSKDDMELLRCYRQDIADAVMYCYGILGEWCWSRVAEAAAAADAREGAGAAGAGAGEGAREAALHVFAAMADAAPRRAPAGLLPLLRHAVLAAHHATAPRTLATALDCLGSYASWVTEARRGGQAGAAEAGAEMVRAAGAALARAPAAAALALRKLCADRAAPAAAAAVAPHLVQVAQRHLQSETGKMDIWVLRQLIGAAGAAMAASPADDASTLLAKLGEAIRDSLISQSIQPFHAAGGAQCAETLLAALHPQPLLAIDFFKVIQPVLPAFAQKPELVELLFLMLRQTISTLMEDCKCLLNDIADLTLRAFETAPCPTGMDVIRLLTLMFGAEWAACPRLVHACVLRAARTVAAVGSAPDLAEALFAALQAITKKKPQYIDWIEDLLPDLVDLGCTCIRMWEAGSARAACGWLAALCGAAPRRVRPRAAHLTAAALRCIGGATPRNHMEPLTELLLALNRAPWEGGSGGGSGTSGGGELQAWLRGALADPGFPTPHATDAHKLKFIAAVVKEKSSKRRLLETVQEFSLVCRGLIGTEYARQSISSKQLVT